LQYGLDLRPLARHHGFLLRQRLLCCFHLLLQLAVLEGEPLDLLVRGLVGLLRDIELAGERRILSRRLQLVQARLPLAHLLLLELQELLVLPSRALVVGDAAAHGIEIGPGLVSLRLDLPEAGGMALGFSGEVANLEIDLLQFFERLQLLSRQRLPPSGPAFSPLRRDMSTLGIGGAFRKNARKSTTRPEGAGIPGGNGPGRSRTCMRPVMSWLLDPHDELEVGAGGGFPGLQLGFAVRRLFGEGGQYFLGELFLAGNTRVNRGLERGSAQINAEAAGANSSLWTGLGLGFEQRTDFFSLSVATNIIFTSTSFTPHWAIHGGVGV